MTNTRPADPLRVYELLGLLVVTFLPWPTVALLIIGFVLHSGTAFVLAGVLAVSGIVLLVAAVQLRKRVRDRSTPAPVPAQTRRAVTPEQRRGSWPWA